MQGGDARARSQGGLIAQHQIPQGASAGQCGVGGQQNVTPGIGAIQSQRSRGDLDRAREGIVGQQGEPPRTIFDERARRAGPTTQTARHHRVTGPVDGHKIGSSQQEEGTPGNLPGLTVGIPRLGQSAHSRRQGPGIHGAIHQVQGSTVVGAHKDRTAQRRPTATAIGVAGLAAEGSRRAIRGAERSLSPTSAGTKTAIPAVREDAAGVAHSARTGETTGTATATKTTAATGRAGKAAARRTATTAKLPAIRPGHEGEAGVL